MPAAWAETPKIRSALAMDNKHRKAKGTQLAVLVLGVALLGAGCALRGGPGGKGKDPDMFSGLVVDSDGRAVPFAKISILPVGEWEEAKRRKKGFEPPPAGSRGLAVTTEGGRWLVDHMSDDLGEDVALANDYYYEITVYKPGFHPWKDSILYERGTLQVDVTLDADAIEIEDEGHMVDTAVDDTNTGKGVLRQGE